MRSGKHCLCDQGFRRFTVEHIDKKIKQEHSFLVPLGVQLPFMEMFVMPTRSFEDFNQPFMERFASLMFATTVDKAMRDFPTVNSELICSY